MNKWSSSPFIPTSLYQCFDKDDGNIDVLKFIRYKRSIQRELEENDYLVIIAALEAEAAAESKAVDANGVEDNRRASKRPRHHSVQRDAVTGQMRQMAYTDTAWYQNYVQSPNLSSKKFHKKFRRRFRCRYDSFQKHLKQVQDDPMFQTWSKHNRDCCGNKPVPIELLLLGALRYIGRGWCLDDLEEATCIGEETHRRFIHVYITWGATSLYKEYVRLPKDAQEAKEWSAEYTRAGFPGCLSSGDATHVGMLKCQFKLKQYMMSHKLDMPSRTYNIHVTHRRRILYTTSGHPARWNDMTLQLYDDYANKMKDGKMFGGDFIFTLLEGDEDSAEDIVYQGPWEIVDNGYLSWPTMVPPSKYYSTYPEMRFSKWIESIRKDVEW